MSPWGRLYPRGNHREQRHRSDGLRQQGTPVRDLPHDAFLSAARGRLRPILLTSLTTIFTLLPVAIGTTVGSKIFQPFAITLIGGLITATLATLIVIPTLAVGFMHS